MPRVSILLPARDAGTTVDAAVESLLAQTFGDFEVWAVDDGSVDDTGARLEAAAARDARVRVLHTPGLGVVGAACLALDHASGELIARMDADDVSLPLRLERSVAALDADASLAGVGTGVEIFRDDRPPSPNLLGYGRWLSSLTTPERLFSEALVESPLCNPATTVRRTALAAVGPWRDGDFPEDWEQWLRLLEGGHRLTCLPEVLHRWRDGESRLTRTDPRYRAEAHLELKAAYLSRRLGPKPLTLWGAGEIGLKLSRLLRARGHEIERFIEVNPRKIGSKLEGIPAVSPDLLPPPSTATHLVAAVGAKGAREEIRGHLLSHGWREGVHFTCVA